jgi:hypothetical protein
MGAAVTSIDNNHHVVGKDMCVGVFVAISMIFTCRLLADRIYHTWKTHSSLGATMCLQKMFYLQFACTVQLQKTYNIVSIDAANT